jgi:hypothetical protein
MNWNWKLLCTAQPLPSQLPADHLHPWEVVLGVKTGSYAGFWYLSVSRDSERDRTSSLPVHLSAIASSGRKSHHYALPPRDSRNSQLASQGKCWSVVLVLCSAWHTLPSGKALGSSSEGESRKVSKINSHPWVSLCLLHSCPSYISTRPPHPPHTYTLHLHSRTYIVSYK